MRTFVIYIFSAICLISAYHAIGQDDSTGNGAPVLKHSISTDPLLPLFNSFALVYEFEKTKKTSLILGFWYGKETETYPKMLDYPGYVVNISPIFACRYYVWKKLHTEYQLYPGYSKYYNKNEDRFYKSFNLFNELRIGYRFNFKLFNRPFMLNLQFPVGFTIYDSNEPDSFKEIRKQDPVFYIFYPNVYFGIRF